VNAPASRPRQTIDHGGEGDSLGDLKRRGNSKVRHDHDNEGKSGSRIAVASPIEVAASYGSPFAGGNIHAIRRSSGMTIKKTTVVGKIWGKKKGWMNMGPT